MSRVRPLAIVAVFALVVLGSAGIGTTLLMQPFARPAHVPAPYWADASLVATGAVTATGLDPLDIDRSLSRAGQGVVVLLMQFGAWAWMITGGLLLIREVTLRRAVTLVRLVVVVSVAIELLAALALWPATRSFGDALFLSVSAFSGTGYATGDPPHPAVQLAVLGPLIVVGELFIFALDGRRTLRIATWLLFWPALIVWAGCTIAKPGFVGPVWSTVSMPTGFVAAAGPCTAGLALLTFLLPLRWLMARDVDVPGARGWWLMGGHAAVIFALVIAPEWLGDGTLSSALTVSAMANSGIGGDALANHFGGSRDIVRWACVIGRIYPVALVALALVVAARPRAQRGDHGP